MNGFHALGALSQGFCRPLAPDRDGINLGEGVALFTMEKSAAGTSLPIRLAGVGESSDAYHATAPDPEGRGAEAAMRADRVSLMRSDRGTSGMIYTELDGIDG